MGLHGVSHRIARCNTKHFAACLAVPLQVFLTYSAARLASFFFAFSTSCVLTSHVALCLVNCDFKHFSIVKRLIILFLIFGVFACKLL